MSNSRMPDDYTAGIVARSQCSLNNRIATGGPSLLAYAVAVLLVGVAAWASSGNTAVVGFIAFFAALLVFVGNIGSATIPEPIRAPRRH